MWTVFIPTTAHNSDYGMKLQFPAKKNKKIQLEKYTAEDKPKNSKRHGRNFLDSSKSTVLGVLKQLHFKISLCFM